MRAVIRVDLVGGDSWEVEYRDGKIVRPANVVISQIEKFLSDSPPRSIDVINALSTLGRVVVLEADEEFIGGLLYDDTKT